MVESRNLREDALRAADELQQLGGSLILPCFKAALALTLIVGVVYVEISNLNFGLSLLYEPTTDGQDPVGNSWGINFAFGAGLVMVGFVLRYARRTVGKWFDRLLAYLSIIAIPIFIASVAAFLAMSVAQANDDESFLTKLAADAAPWALSVALAMLFCLSSLMNDLMVRWLDDSVPIIAKLLPFRLRASAILRTVGEYENAKATAEKAELRASSLRAEGVTKWKTATSMAAIAEGTDIGITELIRRGDSIDSDAAIRNRAPARSAYIPLADLKAIHERLSAISPHYYFDLLSRPKEMSDA